MSRARIQLEPAWVLKAAPYGDTSLLVEAISGAHGRIGVVARGVRAPRSKSRALLQAFRPLLLSWNESGDLGTFSGVEAGGAAPALSGEKIFSGWYLNELLLRLLRRHDPHPVVFDAYGIALIELAQESGLGERALRRFEMILLAELGFGIDLPPDLDPDRIYRYDPDRGVLPADSPSVEGLPGRCLIALREGRLESREDLLTARQLSKAALAIHLGSRALATATILRDLRRGVS
ncbi:MAG: DNA repair protein RecO [Panacagrimonas sp.]